MSNTWSDFSNFAGRNKNAMHVKVREVWRTTHYQPLFIKSKTQGRCFKISEIKKIILILNFTLFALKIQYSTICLPENHQNCSILVNNLQDQTFSSFLQYKSMLKWWWNTDNSKGRRRGRIKEEKLLVGRRRVIFLKCISVSYKNKEETSGQGLARQEAHAI